MTTPDRSRALDHVVVVMFENRSFDNLLGRLYGPGDVESFEGVLDKDIQPDSRVGGRRSRPKGGPYGVAKNMDTPNPDPGEEYQHVNTQLFEIIDPQASRGVLAEKMTAPFNAPARDAPSVASCRGGVPWLHGADERPGGEGAGGGG